MQPLPLAEEVKLLTLEQQGQGLEQLWQAELTVVRLAAQEQLEVLAGQRQQPVAELEQVLGLVQEQGC